MSLTEESVTSKLLTTPNTPTSQLRRLILFSADEHEEELLSKNLCSSAPNQYEILRVETLEALADADIESTTRAVMLDMRFSRTISMAVIRWIGDLRSQVALIALCRDHSQLQNYEEVIHYIDDYILAEQLHGDELQTRINHAIRRRTKEHELLEDQNLLRSLLLNIPDKIFFKDLESRFIKVNESMADAYGFTIDSILGKTDFDLFTEEHARPAYEDEQSIIATGKPIVGKIEKETFADNTVRWAYTTKIPLHGLKGEITGTMGIARDVTELKIAQDKLTEERALLETIVTHALAGIFVKDPEGRYILVNKRHSDYIGAASPESAKGKTIFDFFTGEIADKIDSADREIMNTCEGREGIIDHRAVPGRKERWLLTSKVPLKDDAGNCKGLVGISIDVTTQKENEAALRDAIHTLEETKLQLIESEKLKTVGRMAAGVAHEVKNPLNVVALGADYLRSQFTEPPELVEIINDMNEAVDRASNVIHELLDLSAPHSPDFESTDVNAMIKRVYQLLRHNLNSAHVDLERELSESLPRIAADPNKIEQAIINLFLNAVGAMPNGGTLTVRTYTHRMKSAGSNVSSEMTERFAIGDPIVTIEILDTGHGISGQNAAKLFDPFFSTKSTGEGTGLGLSVTRSIIEIHHGVISLRNRSDCTGACASLHFPAETSPNNPNEK